RSLEESIGMLEMEREQGISHVVATPHFYALIDTPDCFLQKRKEAEQRLRQEMEKHPDLPKLTMGAEVYFFPGISDADFLPKLTIGDTGYILIEMPTPPWPERMYEELALIREKWGITPIIDHIDRYIGPFRTYKIPEKLQELPVLVQANASFFLRKMTAPLALRLMREEKIHLLGSDCHNLIERIPNLRQAVDIIEQKLGPEALQRIHEQEQVVFQKLSV
ncbi:MAG: CpsB/CapC family capsule biosynthesis tyrosine phosphatase, partial [Anaerotignum sp.]